MANQTVTLSRVAQAAGVSLATASQALSGKSRIAPRTRLEVRRIADELGYQGNPLAKALARGFCDDTVSLFALAMDLGVRTQKIKQIQQALRSHGFRAPADSRSCDDYRGESGPGGAGSVRGSASAPRHYY